MPKSEIKHKPTETSFSLDTYVQRYRTALEDKSRCNHEELISILKESDSRIIKNGDTPIDELRRFYHQLHHLAPDEESEAFIEIWQKALPPEPQKNLYSKIKKLAIEHPLAVGMPTAFGIGYLIGTIYNYFA